MHVFIGTPCYSYRTHTAYTMALAGSLHELRSAHMHISLHFESGFSLVMLARNNIVATFLKTNATDLVFIDDDISWNPKDLIRLVRHPVDVVGVACRKKQPEKLFNVHGLDGATPDNTGLLEVTAIGTGMLRISRRVIQTLIEKSPHLAYDDAGEQFALFNTYLHRRQLRGEDYGFCDLWRQHGGKVWCDTEIQVNHWEGSIPYTGKLTTGIRAGQ